MALIAGAVFFLIGLVTAFSLIVAWFMIIAGLTSDKDVSGVIICIVIPPFAVLFAIARMNQSLAPIVLFALGMGGLVVLEIFKS